MMGWLIALSGSVLTLCIFIITIAFRMGEHSARLHALEEWRGSIRDDMHEISDQMEKIAVTTASLKTAVELRTEATHARLVRIEAKLDNARSALDTIKT